MANRIVRFLRFCIIIALSNSVIGDYAIDISGADDVDGANFNANAGWAFHVNYPIRITAFGVCDMYLDGFGGSPPVFLWDDEEQTLLGTFWVDKDSPLEGPKHTLVWSAGGEGQFRYTSLETPVELVPGKAYAVTSHPDGRLFSMTNQGLTASEIDYLGGRWYWAGRPNLWQYSQGVFGPNFKFERIAEEVYVDIRPGSNPNPLNVKSNGVLPVAILGTENFDVSRIGLDSICLAGVTPLRSDYEDVEESDGYLDLALKFRTQDIVAAIGEVDDKDPIELDITGELVDGTPIEGSDWVLIIKKTDKGQKPK